LEKRDEFARSMDLVLDRRRWYWNEGYLWSDAKTTKVRGSAGTGGKSPDGNPVRGGLRIHGRLDPRCTGHRRHRRQIECQAGGIVKIKRPLSIDGPSMKYGIQLAAEVAKDYDKYSYHDHLVSECILGKLNVLQGRPKKNPAAAKIKQALDRLERKVDSLEGTTRFMARAAKRRVKKPLYGCRSCRGVFSWVREKCVECGRPMVVALPKVAPVRMPKEETLADSPEWPDSFWIVDFMKFDQGGRPIEGTAWRWTGIVFNALIALNTAVSAMIDEKPEEAGSWRCVRVAMDRQAVVAQKR
jgi:hypothetical protein